MDSWDFYYATRAKGLPEADFNLIIIIAQLHIICYVLDCK